MRSLQAVTDSQGCGAGAANASFRVTFIVQSDVYRATVFRGKAPPHQRNREPE
jgi:hypothetical protein